MLQKTEGIVLHTIKHSDSGIIAHIFTRSNGRLSFIAKGIHRKKNNIQKVYFQPLQILNIDFYYKQKHELHIIKEVSSAYPFSSIPYDINKNSIALFLSEVLYRSLKDTGPDIPLYDFMMQTLVYLDKSYTTNPNFHIGFMIGLTKYLGIAPGKSYSSNLPYFDMQNGIFVSSAPLHGYYMEKEFSRLLNLFLNKSIQDCINIKLNGSQRTQFLNIILAFYSLHLPGLQNIHSLDIYSQIFS